MTRAYSPLYIEAAQENLGNMFDYAINTCHVPVKTVVSYFLQTCVAREYGKGNPRYVAGRTGCELWWDCLWEMGLKENTSPPALYADKSPEYWAGWALAYYQWLRNIPFKDILEKIPMEKIIRSYWPLHEADIRKFVEIMDEWVGYKKKHPLNGCF